MEQREGRIEQSYFFITKRKQLILLSADIQGITQRQLVLLGNRRRRIQFIIGRLEGASDFTIQLVQHDSCPVCMVGIV